MLYTLRFDSSLINRCYTHLRFDMICRLVKCVVNNVISYLNKTIVLWFYLIVLIRCSRFYMFKYDSK